MGGSTLGDPKGELPKAKGGALTEVTKVPPNPLTDEESDGLPEKLNPEPPAVAFVLVKPNPPPAGADFD